MREGAGVPRREGSLGGLDVAFGVVFGDGNFHSAPGVLGASAEAPGGRSAGSERPSLGPLVPWVVAAGVPRAAKGWREGDGAGEPVSPLFLFPVIVKNPFFSLFFCFVVGRLRAWRERQALAARIRRSGRLFEEFWRKTPHFVASSAEGWGGPRRPPLPLGVLRAPCPVWCWFAGNAVSVGELLV